MKTKKRLAAIILLPCLLLAGCASAISVEELLDAPALTADQSSVIEALSAVSEEKVTLKYPSSGGRRAPIQFVDLDADGSSEAVAFYSLANEFARLAVLKKTDGNWRLVSTTEGAGTDVESLSVIRLENSEGRYLLVEWSSINSRERQLAAYHFSEGEISLGFEEACSEILVYDADSDGYNEFCYITTGSSYEPFKLKYVDNGSGALMVMSECELNAEMLSPAYISSGKLADGRRAVLVDEYISDTEMATEVFVVSEGRLEAVELADGFDIFELSRRSSEALACGAYFGGDSVYIPSRTPPHEQVSAAGEWEYLYAIDGGNITSEGAALVVQQYGFIVLLPEGWETVSRPLEYADTPRYFSIYDGNLELEVLEIRVLEIGELAAPYVSEGYELLAQSGSYRYYIKALCSPEDYEFIKQHFALL
ncbi:MAG: hypothetical protein Q4B42_02700 [Oscillospiraceae bacterium]|nr:hypothetical protein [Oscillospiraceae bacterium]